MALAQKGEPEEAVELLERAVAIEPAYPEAHHNLGLVRAGQRRFAEAIEHYREALSHNPSLRAAHNDWAPRWPISATSTGPAEHGAGHSRSTRDSSRRSTT